MPFFDSRARLRDAAILAIGRVFTAAGAVASTRLLTEYVEPNQLGRYYFYLAIGGFFSLMLFSPLQFYVFRSCLKWREEGSGRPYIKGILGIWLAAAGITACATATYAHFASEGAKGALLITAVPVIVFTEALISSGALIASFLGRRGLFVVVSTLNAWLPALGTVACAIAFGGGAEPMLVGRALALLALGCGIAAVIWRTYGVTDGGRVRPGVDWRDLWHYAWPLVIVNTFMWGQTQGYRVPLAERGGDAVVGVFGVWAALVVGLFGFFDSVFTQLYAPGFWAAFTRDGQAAIRTEVEKLLQQQWSALVMFLFWIVGILPFAERLLLGAGYRGYYWLGALLAFAEMIRLAGTAPTYALQAVNKNERLLLPAVGSFLIVIGGVRGFAGVFDPLLVGALALIGAHLFVSGTTLWRSRRLFRFSLPVVDVAMAAVLGSVQLGMLMIARRWTSDRWSISLGVIAASGLLLLASLYLLARRPTRPPVAVVNL